MGGAPPRAIAQHLNNTVRHLSPAHPLGAPAFSCPDTTNQHTMAIVINATFSKKVGKPNYGSEGFTLTVQSEVTNLDQVKEESHRLFLLLSDSVNEELGAEPKEEKRAEWPTIVRNTPASQEWKASDKQRDLILKVIADNNLDRSDVESLAYEMFGTSNLPELNRLQASGLIDELLSRYGKKRPAGQRFNGRASR